MQRPHPHIAAASPAALSAVTTAAAELKRGKKRGSYNCGRCGLPKKGHNCNVKTPTSATVTPTTDSSLTAISAISAPSSSSALRQAPSHLRRALSFDDFDDPLEPDDRGDGDSFEEPLDPLDLDLDPFGLPASLMWEVLKRLPPAGLLAAAKVCRGWRETARRLWRSAEELKLRVPASIHVGYVSSMLQKCPGIVRLSLRMERCEDSFDSLEAFRSVVLCCWFIHLLNELIRLRTKQRNLKQLKLLIRKFWLNIMILHKDAIWRMLQQSESRFIQKLFWFFRNWWQET